jgi:DNA gyrase/topoisomerase IV subunit B
LKLIWKKTQMMLGSLFKGNSCSASTSAKAREMVQRKTVMGGGGLPGKLSDCSEQDPAKCEVYLVEEIRQVGTAKQGRDRCFQTILPLHW